MDIKKTHDCVSSAATPLHRLPNHSRENNCHKSSYISITHNLDIMTRFSVNVKTRDDVSFVHKEDKDCASFIGF